MLNISSVTVNATFLQGSVKTKMIILPFWTPVSILVIILPLITITAVTLVDLSNNDLQFLTTPHGGARRHKTAKHIDSVHFSITK